MVRAWNSIFHLKAYSAEYNDPSTLSIINAYGIYIQALLINSRRLLEKLGIT